MLTTDQVNWIDRAAVNERADGQKAEQSASGFDHQERHPYLPARRCNDLDHAITRRMSRIVSSQALWDQQANRSRQNRLVHMARVDCNGLECVYNNLKEEEIISNHQ